MKKYIFDFIFRAIGVAGTLITAYYSSLLEINIYLFSVLMFCIGICAIMLAFDALSSFTHIPFRCNKYNKKCNKKIAEHMLKHIKSSGPVAIFSKDLTWVEINNEAFKVLSEKAKKNEVTIFVSKQTTAVTKLKSENAKIFIYNKNLRSNFKPKSRFTIIDFEGSGERIMLGVVQDGEHIINHYNSQNSDVVHLASDFIQMIKLSSRAL